MTKHLLGMRIIICGKGGSGKSTVVTLMARVLRDKGYRVHVLDGDASNPGLYRMLGFEETPESLIDFYGGKLFSGGKVTCPVDDPTPLSGGEISLNELPSKYFVEREGITFFRSGKIRRAFEGCDGPESKITRDFRIPGDQVTLVDINAGTEHFARGVEASADGVIVMVNPNFTSFQIAERVKKMVEEMRSGVPPATVHLENPQDVKQAEKIAKSAKVKYLWTVLNEVKSEEVKSIMTRALKKRGIEPIGSVRYDPEIFKSSLEGVSLRESGAKKDVEKIVSRLEEFLTQIPKQGRRT